MNTVNVRFIKYDFLLCIILAQVPIAHQRALMHRPVFFHHLISTRYLFHLTRNINTYDTYPSLKPINIAEHLSQFHVMRIAVKYTNTITLLFYKNVTGRSRSSYWRPLPCIAVSHNQLNINKFFLDNKEAKDLQRFILN